MTALSRIHRIALTIAAVIALAAAAYVAGFEPQKTHPNCYLVAERYNAKVKNGHAVSEDERRRYDVCSGRTEVDRRVYGE